MELTEIMNELTVIKEGLDCGTINFTVDKLASAMKYGHPVEFFDSIIGEVFWIMQGGVTPEREKVEELLKGLKRFKRTFKVKELGKPIKELESYLANQ